MKKHFVLVADGSHARFFTLRARDIPEMESGPTLIETGTLNNEVVEQPDHEVFANDSGRNKAPVGGGAHGYDDHRGNHKEEFRKRFAEQIVEHLRKQLKDVEVLTISANPDMVAHLRAAVRHLPAAGCEIRECPEDLTKQSAQQIHNHLAKQGHLPERKEPTQPTRFRQA
ncbi:MAG: host attachment protein [Verrucomicrobiota bacterium]